ncbi:hypothetical protein Q3G72_016951 [Acer saccharum]|nr:hypothetical protein Q3G72_016951 [Acer saccharum]
MMSSDMDFHLANQVSLPLPLSRYEVFVNHWVAGLCMILVVIAGICELCMLGLLSLWLFFLCCFGAVFCFPCFSSLLLLPRLLLGGGVFAVVWLPVVFVWLGSFRVP